MVDLYSLSQKRDELTWKLNRLTDIIERDLVKVNEIDQLELQLKKYNEEMNETMNKRNLIHDLIDDQHTLSLLDDQIYEYTKQLNNLNNEYVSVLEAYNRLKNQQLQVYASILAHNLKENSPCPVCGSIHHPDPAKLLDIESNEKELEEITKQYNRIRNTRDEMSITLGQLNDRHQQVNIQVTQYKRQLNIEEDLSKELLTNMLYSIDRKTQNKLKQYKKDENELIYLKKLSKSVKDSIALKNRYIEEISQLDEEINTIKELNDVL